MPLVALIAANVAVFATGAFIWLPELLGEPISAPRTQIALTVVAYLPTIALIALAWRVVDAAPLAALGYVPGPRRAISRLVGGTAAGTAVMTLGGLLARWVVTSPVG